MTPRFTGSGLGLTVLVLVAAGGLAAAADGSAPAPVPAAAPAWPAYDGQLDCRSGVLDEVADFGLDAWAHGARTAEDALAAYLGALRNGGLGRALKALTYERRAAGPDGAVFVGLRPDGSRSAAVTFVTGGQRWLRTGLSQC